MFIRVFFSPEENIQKQIKLNLKEVYDLAKSEEIKSIKSNALPELIIQNFDLEQIWQQIELQNNSLLTRSLINVSKLLTSKDKLVFNNADTGNVEQDTDESNLEENENENDSEDIKSDSLSVEEDEGSDNDNRTTSAKQIIKPSIVDDEFFKLNEMENFLNMEEKKMNEPDSGNDTEDDDDESVESINFFEDNDDNDDDDPIKTARYKDFFVEKEQVPRKAKRNRFLEENEADEMNNLEKSTLEKRQERLQMKIQELEENAISEKPWTLKGEVTADGRPQNSLLEEIVEFDLTSRPAPVITEQTTMQLEDIIKQRIKDKVFDSVERKEKPVDTLLEYKKKLVLDQEKSKQSLAQIYEKEFLDQQAALDPENQDKEQEEPQLHQEVKSLMTSLFNKLDALSNFHFTPKPAQPELKIVSNLPAISMEEVAPVAASEAALLAPEEVRNKVKGDLIGKSERSDTDKKRERRKKKIKQHIHVKEKEKKQQKANNMRPGLGNKYTKEKTKKIIDTITKDKNVDKVRKTIIYINLEICIFIIFFLIIDGRNTYKNAKIFNDILYTITRRSSITY